MQFSSFFSTHSINMLSLLFYLLAITAVDGFKLDLIHRNPTLSLTQHFLNSASNYHTIKLLHQKTEVQTTVTPNGGDYLLKLSVGTPPLDLLASVSLAHDLTWFQCEPCDRCYRQQKTAAIFNPAMSRTYKRLPCDSDHCSNLDTEHIACDHKYNECRYWYSYGNGSSTTTGVMNTDTFLLEHVSFDSTVFGCGFEQSGLFDWASSGLVGLGSGPLSLVSQMGPAIGHRFSYCLAPPNRTSTLTFGTDSDSDRQFSNTGQQQTVRTGYSTREPRSFYNLNLTAITMGPRRLPVARDIIIDVGTTLTYLNPTLFKTLIAMVTDVIGLKPMPENQSQSMLCYDTRGGPHLTPPDIGLEFSGAHLKLNAENIFLESNGIACLSIVTSGEDGDPMVLGSLAQINLEVEYDLLNKTVSFTPRNCGGP